jgi:hypothetical protein
MEKGTHGRNEKSFEDLSFQDQAKSINGQVRIIEKAILAHSRKKGDQDDKKKSNTLDGCIDQLKRLIVRLEDKK